MVSLPHLLPDLPTSLVTHLHAFFLSLFRQQISKKKKKRIDQNKQKKKTTAKANIYAHRKLIKTQIENHNI